MDYTAKDIRAMARKAGISLRGNKNDVDYFNGYSYKRYRYVAIDNGEMWEGYETGNFLPYNVETFTVIRKSDKASEVIERLLLNLSIWKEQEGSNYEGKNWILPWTGIERITN